MNCLFDVYEWRCTRSREKERKERGRRRKKGWEENPDDVSGKSRRNDSHIRSPTKVQPEEENTRCVHYVTHRRGSERASERAHASTHSLTHARYSPDEISANDGGPRPPSCPFPRPAAFSSIPRDRSCTSSPSPPPPSRPNSSVECRPRRPRILVLRV